MSAIQWLVGQATKPRQKWEPVDDLQDEGRKQQAQRIVRALRKAGSMTRQQIAAECGWSETKVADVVRFGEKTGLFTIYKPPKVRTGPFRAQRIMLK